MATAVIMPRQGQSVESCIIGKWHKKKGDKVSEGDTLFTYETDKATFDEAAKVSGEILEVFFEEGDDVPVLVNVCVIGEPGEDISGLRPEGSSAEQAGGPGQEAELIAPDKKEDYPEAQTAAGQNIYVSNMPEGDASNAPMSPRAKALAAKRNADLRFAEPSGPKGRIIERDVQKIVSEGHLATFAAGMGHPAGVAGSGIGGRVSVADIGRQPATSVDVSIPESYEEKHSNIRKIIAKSMHESLSTMAQLTLNASFDATDILDLRAKMKKAKENGMAERLGLSSSLTVPTINDIILYSVSRVLKTHRLCNAHYYPDKLVFFNTVNLGMAVDTPRGLMVPTIFAADKLSIAEISVQAKTLAADCQKGTISPDFIKNGTFTVTNLGSLGVESFTPVINPPQTCILGVNTITTAVKNVAGNAVPYQSMSLSLTFDHRALDGAPAARFLKDLKETLENFSLLLMQ
ncbi:MAG: dihydrolipoamide acetyltransferase family protein [Eubacteriales bacterium]|nr:dihydrolipoamide acetyltransferase family protein [Eubacteriales bacterium]MDD4326595.1 dihydrolipoamide acetyltransferase family protein [Eubacteriales bacterium]